VVKAIAEGTISWTADPDFGYQLATEVPGLDDAEKLRPRTLYEAQGRLDEYREFVERFKRERREHLEQFPHLSKEIVSAVE
jgi:phosphoenolpyruvate carboxykinase (ATP)